MGSNATVSEEVQELQVIKPKINISSVKLFNLRKHLWQVEDRLFVCDEFLDIIY